MSRPAIAVSLIAFALVLIQVPLMPARPAQDAASSPVALPRAFVDTSYELPTGCEEVDVGIALSGGCKIITVDAGQSLQTALDHARRGDIVRLAANQSFTGPFELPDKGPGTGWVYVVSSALARLPGPGNRLNPNLGGTCGTEGALPCGVKPNAALSDLPRIMSGGGVPHRWLATAHGADRYRFIGIAFETTPGEQVGLGIRLNEDAHHRAHATPEQKTSDIIFDRCLMRGSYTAPFAGRAIAITGERHAVVNSYLSAWVDDDSDTQAILVHAYAPVFAVINNYLEATGENVYTDDVEAIDGVVHTPSDGEIRGNYLRKLVEWNSKRPSWNNTKTQFEMKSGQRILFEGNLLETTYRQAQEASINIKIGDEDPRKFVNDVTIRLNVIRHAANGIKVCATQCNSDRNRNVATGIAVYNNVFDNVDGGRYGSAGTDGHGFSLLVTGPRFYIDHNTFLNSHEGLSLVQRGTGVPDNQTLVITNNIWHVAANPLTGAEAAAVSRAAVYTNNLLVGASCWGFPAGNQCPPNWNAVGFANYNNGSGGDYTLGADSRYRGAGADSYGAGTTDPGANVAAVTAATACAMTGQCAPGAGGSPGGNEPRKRQPLAR